MHILIKIIVLTFSFNQLRAAPVDEFILPKIMEDETLASCKSFNSFLDSANGYLKKCQISSSKIPDYNSFSLPQLLCLSFYDINLRLCEMRNKYTNLALPTNVSQVVDFLNDFDQDPIIAKEFCSKSPEQVSYGQSSKLLNYAAEFQDSFNDSVSCNLMCIEQIVPKKYKINPFCKIFLWGNLQLKVAKTYLENLAKTTQQSKTLGNTSSKNSEPQPAVVSNETIVRTGERPQLQDVITQEIAGANVTNVLSTTSDNISNHAAKVAEPEGVLPEPNMVVPAPDRVVPAPDRVVPAPDRMVLAPERLVPVPDRVVPAPDGVVPALDTAVPAPDRVVPAPDTVVPAPDTAGPAPDTVVPAPDRVVPAPERVVPAPMAVENPPIIQQPPIIDDFKSANANSNNQIDSLNEKDEYDMESDNEIDNSGLEDPLPQNPNVSNELPIQLEPIRKSSMSSEKADKGVVFEKNLDTNPKMVITGEQFVEAENGHFFPFFLSAVALSVLAYVLLHNKKKVMALLIEGRQGNGGGRRRNSRGHAYRRLDTLEQAITSKSQTAPPANIIY